MVVRVREGCRRQQRPCRVQEPALGEFAGRGLQEVGGQAGVDGLGGRHPVRQPLSFVDRVDRGDMQRASPHRRQRVVQRVAEHAVSDRHGGHLGIRPRDELLVDQRVQRRGAVGGAQDGAQDRHGRGTAEHGQRLKGRHALGGNARQLTPHHGRGQGGPVRSAGTRGAMAVEQASEIQRMAAGPLHQATREHIVGEIPERGGHHGRRFRLRQLGQSDVGQRGHRVQRVQDLLVPAVRVPRGQHQAQRPALARGLQQRLQRGAVRPLGVVHEQGPGGRRCVQQLPERARPRRNGGGILRRPRTRAPGRGAVRHPHRRPMQQTGQTVDVGSRRGRCRRAVQHGEVTQAGQELTHEGRLSDAGRPLYEDDRGRARAGRVGGVAQRPRLAQAARAHLHVVTATILTPVSPLHCGTAAYATDAGPPTVDRHRPRRRCAPPRHQSAINRNPNTCPGSSERKESGQFLGKAFERTVREQ